MRNCDPGNKQDEREAQEDNPEVISTTFRNESLVHRIGGHPRNRPCSVYWIANTTLS